MNDRPDLCHHALTLWTTFQTSIIYCQAVMISPSSLLILYCHCTEMLDITSTNQTPLTLSKLSICVALQFPFPAVIY